MTFTLIFKSGFALPKSARKFNDSILPVIHNLTGNISLYFKIRLTEIIQFYYVVLNGL